MLLNVLVNYVGKFTLISQPIEVDFAFGNNVWLDNFFGSNKFLSDNIFLWKKYSQNIWFRKDLWLEKNSLKYFGLGKNFGWEKCLVGKNIVGWIYFWNKFWSETHVSLKKIKVRKKCWLANSGWKNVWLENFLDKAWLEKVWLEKVWWEKLLSFL